MFEKLSFPLNVYAKILQLDGQKVEYLHFGLFESIEEPIHTAQQRSTDLIFKFLPRAPASVLEIGVGLGTTQKYLIEQGYHAEGISPDEEQIRIAKEHTGSDTLYCSRFEDYVPNRKYDVILAQESSQYIDLPDLLPKVSSLLLDGGKLILLDEFSLKRSGIQPIHIHHLDYLRHLASVVGMECSYELDLSKQAAVTMEYIESRIERFREEIHHFLGGDEHRLALLENSTRDYRRRYNNGEFGYGLLVFSKVKRPSWELLRVRRADLSAFEQLFQACFGKTLNASQWDWKYGKDHGLNLGLWHNGKLIAHYGGAAREIYFFGERTRAVQVTDSMVSPGQRGLLTRKGAFYQLAQTFLQSYVGYGSPFVLGYGFPNARVMRLAEALGLYTKVGEFVNLVWSRKKTRPHPFVRIRQLQATDRERLNVLWSKMASRLVSNIVGIRDWDYLQHRYHRHPTNSYLLLKIEQRVFNRLVAVFVLRREGSEYQLIDMVCLPEHIPLVARQAMRVTDREGGDRLIALVSTAIKPFFKEEFDEEEDPGISIPTSACSMGPAVEELTGKWWLQAGDSDFM